MKKFFFYFVFVTFISQDLILQTIDPSVLSELSKSEIEILKNEAEKLGVVGKENPKPNVTESTIKSQTKDINKIKGSKYGYSFFNSVPTSISALGDLPLPNNYKISLKDQFTVILSGSKEAIFDLDVNLDGTILFPELGSISVVGETFLDVKEKLKNLINQSYIGVQIDLSLKNLAAKKVTIVGAVKTPGTYLVNPFSTISSALGYSGGISEVGTLRNIKLIRLNGEVFKFDLYKLLINGDRSEDINIEAGDVILIEAANQFISINGEVNRPAIYEIKKEEKLGELIDFALGFTRLANKENISLSLLNIPESIIEQKSTRLLDEDLENVLSVNVYSYLNKNKSSILVRGAIKEPGFYELTESEKLEDIIEKIEFIDVYPWAAILEQFDDENLIRTSKIFSLKDKSTYKNIKVLPGAKIFFANVNDRNFVDIDNISSALIRDFSLRVSHKEDLFELPIAGSFEAKSIVNFLGLDMTDVDNEAAYISPLDDEIIRKDYAEMTLQSKKYNRLIFRSPVNDLITVRKTGSIELQVS